MGSFALLRQNRNFALVWLGSLISMAGDWMLFVALPMHVYQVTGSTLATGAMLATRIAPRLLLGSVAGVFVDRWDRRQTLVTVNLILAAGLLPLLLVHSVETLWIVYAVSFVQACFAQFVSPAEGALLPQLVAPEQLVAANSLNTLNDNAARLIGPPAGGFLVGLGGVAGVAVTDSLTFLLAALLVWLTRIDARPQRTEQPPEPGSAWVGLWREWLAGLRIIWRTRTLAIMFAFMALTSIGEGVMGTLMVPFVLDVLGSDELGFGWILSAQAIGGLIGSLVISWRGVPWTPGRMIGAGAIGLCLFDLMTFNYHVLIPGIGPAIVFMALVGLPVAVMLVGYSTLVQVASTDEYRGRVLGAINAVAGLARLVGVAIAGTLGNAVGIVTMLNIQGLGYFLAGLMVLVLVTDQASERREAASKRQAAAGSTP